MRALILMAATLCAGCSVNGVGLARTEVFATPGASVMRTEAYGIIVRTHRDDAGVTFGYGETLWFGPRDADTKPPGRYLFGIGTPAATPAAVIRRSFGADLALNRTAIGANLGFAEDAVFGRVTQSESVAWRLEIEPDAPEKTQWRDCLHERDCRL